MAYPFINPYAQPYYPQSQQAYASPYQQPQTAQQGQTMTPPTIRAEIIQLPEDEIDRYPMAAGTSQMFMTTDDGHLIIKSMYQNGQYEKTYYDKRPPAPPAPVFDPSEYARKEDVEEYVQRAVEAAVKEALK